MIYTDLLVDKEAYGEINYIKQTIQIDKSLLKDKQEEVLIHEIIHGILEVQGFVEENENEHLIQCLANGLYQVLKSNQLLRF